MTDNSRKLESKHFSSSFKLKERDSNKFMPSETMEALNKRKKLTSHNITGLNFKSNGPFTPLNSQKLQNKYGKAKIMGQTMDNRDSANIFDPETPSGYYKNPEVVKKMKIRYN